MPNMIPITVETRPLGFLGVIAIIAVLYILYTLCSMALKAERYKKLEKARKLIEEGHQRKVDAEIKNSL